MRQILAQLGLKEEDIIQIESILTDNIHFEMLKISVKASRLFRVFDGGPMLPPRCLIMNFNILTPKQIGLKFIKPIILALLIRLSLEILVWVIVFDKPICFEPTKP
jgi:hypothetical protein